MLDTGRLPSLGGRGALSISNQDDLEWTTHSLVSLFCAIRSLHIEKFQFRTLACRLCGWCHLRVSDCFTSVPRYPPHFDAQPYFSPLLFVMNSPSRFMPSISNQPPLLPNLLCLRRILLNLLLRQYPQHNHIVNPLFIPLIPHLQRFRID